jgi:hypothetical protein
VAVENIIYHESWTYSPRQVVRPHISVQCFSRLGFSMTKLLLTHELAHLLLSYTTMVSPSMDVKSRNSTTSRISKAPGFHWWCIIMQCKWEVINEGAGPIQRGGLTTCPHQIVDSPLVLLSIAAIRSLCRGLSSTTWPILLQPSFNSGFPESIG